MEERSMPAAGSSSGSGRFVVWLHGLGDCGSANEFIADHFSAAAFSAARWAFPTAPTAPVTCNRAWVSSLLTAPALIHPLLDAELLIDRNSVLDSSQVKSVRDEEDVLRAVQIVHAMIDMEAAAGTNPEDVFVFGLSQGGALSIASVLLYPKALGGCAVFSGFLPFNSSSFAARVTDDAKKAPILWIHGGADSLIPIQEGQDGVKFLRGLGMSCEFKAARAQRVAGAASSTSNPKLPSSQRSADANKLPSSSFSASRVRMAAVPPPPPPAAGGFLLWLHGSGGSGDESRAEVAPYFAAPGLASSVRMSFPTAPTARIACYGDAVITAWFGIGEVPITATPVLWFHGMADGLVLFEAGHAGCAFLEELGMSCEFKPSPWSMGSLVRFLFTLAAVVGAAALLAASLRRRAPPSGLPARVVPSSHMAGRNRSFVLWLHGLGDSGPANEPIRNLFSAPEFRLTKWSFPSAPRSPVSCNRELPPAPPPLYLL
ncbi:hypothetical protein HU200_006718 [Digitaria exilis]|uniref:Phospholipase/carboxylesterase/thioesterase domain-containing protein n=1 Tax=Digitaria exilis TaxID=1010633 RepID=A0A835FNG8_9POAL|nr:hypothetical protein HU200_006718 [Digitaria exilis]